MTQFYEGKDVEVASHDNTAIRQWRKAKIVARASDAQVTRSRQWAVQFPDGSRVVFDVEHIRDVPRSLYEQRNDGPVFAPSEEQIDRGFYD